MNDHDYNRRMATALGIDQGFDFTAPPGSQYAPPDYATDWRELPAILAAISKFNSWQAFGGHPHRQDSVSMHLDGFVEGRGSTLLLAAGALLLRLTEEVTRG